MKVHILEAFWGEELALKEVHLSEDSAKVSLYNFFAENWDDGLMGIPFELVNDNFAKAEKAFLDADDSFHYGILNFEIQPAGQQEAPWSAVQPDLFNGMEPVVLLPAELGVIRYCLNHCAEEVPYGRTRDYLRRNNGLDIGPEQFMHVLENIKEKMK